MSSISLSNSSLLCLGSDVISLYFAGVSKYPPVLAELVAARLGSAIDGSQPLFLLIGADGEAIEGTGEGRRRGPGLSCRTWKVPTGAVDGCGSGWPCPTKGLEIPGTDRLKVNGKGITTTMMSKAKWMPTF